MMVHVPHRAQDFPTGALLKMPSPPYRSLYADDPLMQPLITDYVNRLPAQVAELRRALAAHDPDSLRKICHQLKGSGATFGFPPISTHAAAALEKLHSGLPPAAIGPDIATLLDYIEHIDNYKSQ
jgi:HPt (histidine-containing phosphotransfer) domain-containing protein